MGILTTKLNALQVEIESSIKDVTDRIEETLDRIEAEKASDLEPGTTVRETSG